jgi:hypothetical protein
MFDTRLPSQSLDYHYVAYLRKFPKDPTDEKDKGEMVRMNLTKNFAESKKRYQALFKGKEEQREYYSGTLSHTKDQRFYEYKTRGLGKIARFDVYELLTDYEQQELKNFTASGCDEKTALLKTKKEWDSHLKKEFDKLKDLNKGSSDTLFKKYTFVAMVYDRNTHAITQRRYSGYWNMKQAM